MSSERYPKKYLATSISGELEGTEILLSALYYFIGTFADTCHKFFSKWVFESTDQILNYVFVGVLLGTLLNSVRFIPDRTLSSPLFQITVFHCNAVRKYKSDDLL
jgi:hypothetical protein